MRPSLLSACRLAAGPIGLLLTLTPASAEIYKCPQVGGGTSYQATPCPGAGGPATIHVDQPGAEAEAAARQRAEADEKAARQFDGEWAERRRNAHHATERRSQERQAHQTRCDRYLADAERYDEQGRRHAKGPGGRAASDRAEGLRARHFSECFSQR